MTRYERTYGSAGGWETREKDGLDGSPARYHPRCCPCESFTNHEAPQAVPLINQPQPTRIIQNIAAVYVSRVSVSQVFLIWVKGDLTRAKYRVESWIVGPLVATAGKSSLATRLANLGCRWGYKWMMEKSEFLKACHKWHCGLLWFSII